jgi:hypothetical protein
MSVYRAKFTAVLDLLVMKDYCAKFTAVLDLLVI